MKHLISLIPGFILAPFSRYFARYSYQNKLDGAIMGVGYAIIFAALFSNPAWNHLTFYTLGPGAAIVLWSMFCPSSSGMSVVIFIIIQIGMFGLAAVYVTISLITAAASSPSYKPSATKATVVVTQCTVAFFFIHIIRKRIPLFDLPGQMAQSGGSMLLLSQYWAPVRLLPGDFLIHVVAFIYIALAIGLLVSFFLVPATSGSAARKMLGTLLGSVGNMYRSVGDVYEAVQHIENTDTVKEGNLDGVAECLEDKVTPIYELDLMAGNSK